MRKKRNNNKKMKNQSKSIVEKNYHINNIVLSRDLKIIICLRSTDSKQPLIINYILLNKCILSKINRF